MENVSLARPAALVAALLLAVGASLHAAPAPIGSIRGVVRDIGGGTVRDAAVSVAAANGVLLTSTITAEDGAFRVAVPAGRHELSVTATGFRAWRSVVDVAGQPLDVDVVLDVATHDERVTVSAARGLVGDLERQPQSLNVLDADRLWERTPTVLAQVVEGEPGLALQRTGPTMAGVFVRGLTGNKVNVYIDGVRYSTAAARGGVNTFLSLVSPTFVDRIEVLRGPASAQYGSDAIGGSVQVLTKAPVFGESLGRRWRGEVGAWGGSADWSAGTTATVSYAGSRGGVVAGANGQRTSTLRPGGGNDSHAAATRFLGLPASEVSGERVPDSAFSQYGGFLRAQYATAPSSHVVAYYARSQQDGGRRTDQLLGGDGNLVADLRNLMADFGYVRYSQLDAGWLDRVTVTLSVNSQREERVNQGGNGNPRALVTHEYERITQYGVQVEGGRRLGARHEISAGAEYAPERVTAPSFGFDPVTGTSATRRGRVPDGSTFRTAAAWVQHEATLSDALRVDTGVRYTSALYRARASDAPLVGGVPLWPDDRVSAGSFSLRTGATWALSPQWILAANVGRGFRAPHITDLGTLGLTGSGFEVAAPDVAGLDATIGTTAGSDATSTGLPVAQIAPETSFSYEGSLRYDGRRLRASVTGFVNTVYDAITRQALILPQGAVGTAIGDQTIVAQGTSGIVFVPLSTAPVLARANFGDARIRGVEAFAEWRPSPRWLVGVTGTSIHSADLETGAAPNIEGGTPAPNLHVRVLYSFSERAWIEPSVDAAGRQRRLSSLDIEDRRTGAFRSHTTIRNFFTRGATVRGWIAAGDDVVLGTSDDLLTATGETLAAVQDRVLGAGVSGAPLFTSVKPYVVFNLRAGVRVGRSLEVGADLLNIGDANYRGISWGIDAPGRSFVLRVKRSF
jgi:outer membrane receptor protein involved in Fe transport